MTQLTMYSAQVNSPELFLTVAHDGATPTIWITGAVPNKLPAAPNLFIIGTGEDAETILYPTDGVSVGGDNYRFDTVTRHFQGSSKAWDINTSVSRQYTAYDQDTFKANIVDLESRKIAREEYTANTILAATTTATPVPLTIAASTILGRKATGDISAMTASEARTVLELTSVSKPTYDAIVFQDSTYTYAYDKTGTLLSSVLISANTDDIPINAAITYVATLTTDSPYERKHGTVFIARGMYHPGATSGVSHIIMSAGVDVVCDHQATVFHITANTYDFCRMARNARWDGGFVYFYGTNFTKDGFVFMGSDLYQAYSETWGLRNCTLWGDSTSTFGGRAINLKCNWTTGDAQYLQGGIFENIRINGKWEYGISMNCLGGTIYKETMSWNTFRNIAFLGNKYCLHMYTAGTYDVQDSNLFENFYLQPRASSPYTVDAYTIIGENNTFINMSCGDWTVNEGYQFVIGSSANVKNNRFIGCWNDVAVGATHTVSDGGTSTKWIACPGWITENKGRTSVTLTSGSGTITHGLSKTPTWAICNATTDGDSVTVTTLGATTLTVKVTTAAGGNGTTQYINWMCGV